MELLKILGRKKRYLFWLLIVLVIGIFIKKTLLAPPLVKVVTIQKRDLKAEVYGNGTVEAQVVVGISSRITGRIVALYADQGDNVKKGQLLAKLENDDLVQQQQQSEALVKRSGANLEVEKANLQKARANLVLAKENAGRYKSLLESGAVSRQETELYENSYRVALEDVARSSALIKAVQMEQDANSAGLGFARSKVADTQIYAPMDGIIITRELEKGATATPGQPIFTLADPVTIWVRANLDESVLKGVTVGKSAVIKLRSSPGEEWGGHVARLGLQSDRVTEELQVEVAFDRPLKDFRLGEQSEVFITTEVKNMSPSIPAGALVTREKKRGVWVVEKGRLKFSEVTVGIRDRTDIVEISGGLDVRDRVVVAAPDRMAKFHDGMKVRTE